LQRVIVRDVASGERSAITPAAVFIMIGQDPNSSIASPYVQTDPFGYILTGHDLLHGDSPTVHAPWPFETSARGVFAAGDVRYGSAKQVAAAVGEGAGAAIAIRDYLRQA
jgi:thioredoxin reductase (NADPH)